VGSIPTRSRQIIHLNKYITPHALPKKPRTESFVDELPLLMTLIDILYTINHD